MTVSGIVLAGGMSRRLGRDKAVEPVGGKPLISRVISRLNPITDEIVVVVNSEARVQDLPIPPNTKTVVDIYPDAGSLSGIFSGLTVASGDWGFVVACDMPFLNTELIAYMLTFRKHHDAVVPTLNGYPEPTHAAYSKACLPYIERKLKANQLKIAGFFDDVRVKYVYQDDVDGFDSEHLSFFNVNTPRDLERALALADAGR